MQPHLSRRFAAAGRLGRLNLPGCYHSRPFFSRLRLQGMPMIELNPIRNRIADLIGRLDSLRGFL